MSCKTLKTKEIEVCHLASSLLYFTDVFGQFGLWATFSPAGTEQMHWKHQVISVGVMHLSPFALTTLNFVFPS